MTRDARLARVADHHYWLAVAGHRSHGGRRPAAHSRTSHDRRRPAAGDRHGDPAGLAGLRLARHRGRPGALRRPSSCTVMPPRTEPGSLPGNFIWDIAEDANQDLWIAMRDGGVARWNGATDTFTIYRHDPNESALAGERQRSRRARRLARPRLDRHERRRRRHPRSRLRRHIEHLRHDPNGRPRSAATAFSRCRSPAPATSGSARRRARPLGSARARMIARFGPPAGAAHRCSGQAISRGARRPERRGVGRHLRRAA